jgi:Bacterial fructose-1,6-bisphosphatase, glpX-encoded
MPATISVPPQQLLECILTLEIVRVTERAAVSAAQLRGQGNNLAADRAVVDAMRRELKKMPIDGTVVIGGVDICMSIGGAPEACWWQLRYVVSAAQMQCRLVLDTDEKRERAARLGIGNPQKIFVIEGMVKGDCLFAATGVTDRALVASVKFHKQFIETETIVMRSVTGTVRIIRGQHRQLENSPLLRSRSFDHSAITTKADRMAMAPVNRRNDSGSPCNTTPIAMANSTLVSRIVVTEPTGLRLRAHKNTQNDNRPRRPETITRRRAVLSSAHNAGPLRNLLRTRNAKLSSTTSQAVKANQLPNSLVP